MKVNEQAVLRFMSAPDYSPMDQSQLARAMGIASKDRGELRDILRRLTETGKVSWGAQSRYALT